MKLIDLRKQRFGRLEVIERVENIIGKPRWLCKCDCGNFKVVLGSSLKRGHTRSCGCLNDEVRIKTKTIHGHCKNGISTRTYKTWNSLHERCNNHNTPNYKYYGGKGVTVCEKWKSFENFLQDMGERPKNMTIDRKDTDGNYASGNCRWATILQQNRNRRNSKVTPLIVVVIKAALKKGVLMQKEIAALLNISASTISRINTGGSWGLE